MRTMGPAILATIGPALLALVLIIAACARGATPTSGPSPTATRAPVASPTPIVAATPAPTAAPAVDSGQAPAAAPAAFFLEIAAPKDESVVRESSVLVLGRTVPDAIVSVNGQVVEVDPTGKFSTRVNLERGPNSIEIIASDFRGNYQPKVITIIYI